MSIPFLKIFPFKIIHWTNRVKSQSSTNTNRTGSMVGIPYKQEERTREHGTEKETHEQDDIIRQYDLTSAEAKRGKIATEA